jgi:hypothetical protein
MLVVYGVELNSIFANYFEYKDINIQVNIWGFIKKKVEGLFEIKEVKDDK